MLDFRPFMANIKSAQKRARQAVERRTHNMSLRTEVRTAIKNVSVRVAAAQGQRRESAARVAARIDRIVAKGILHRNAGDRHKCARARVKG